MIKVFYDWAGVDLFLKEYPIVQERSVFLGNIVIRNRIFGTDFDLEYKPKGYQKIYIYMPHGPEFGVICFMFDFSGEIPIEILEFIPPAKSNKVSEASDSQSREPIPLDNEIARLITPECIRLLLAGEYDEYIKTYGFHDKIVESILKADPNMERQLKIAKLVSRKNNG